MKITFVISSLGAGGAERVVSGLANYWVDAGHDVTLVTLSSADEKPFYKLSTKIKVRALGLADESGGVFRRAYNIFRRITKLRQSLKSTTPDVILSSIDVTNMLTLLATAGMKAPVLVAEHTHPKYHALPALYKKLRGFLYPKAAYVIMLTTSAASYFPKLKNIIVMPNAIEKPKQIQPLKMSEIKKLISVGRLIKSKAFDDLIHAFAEVSGSYSHLSLDIWGQGPERHDLEKLIREKKMSDKIFLRGMTSDIASELIKADLFVFPSLYEGFPTALGEAMALGLPVIASDCSGNVDLVQDQVNGRLFKAGNWQALRGLLEEVLNAPEKAREYGRQACGVSDQYNAEKIYGMWDGLIESLHKKGF